MTIEIGLLITIIGCFIGILGYMSTRDKKIISDSTWKGEVNAKLDVIIGIKSDIKEVRAKRSAGQGGVCGGVSLL